jgi:hypothetical protein
MKIKCEKCKYFKMVAYPDGYGHFGYCSKIKHAITNEYAMEHHSQWCGE